MRPDHARSLDDIVRRELDGPPPPGFDCGRDAQNRFLYNRALIDQQEWISTTYLYRAGGVVAAFFTACHDSIPLGTRERPRGIPYKDLGAIKLAQLGVDRRFQGMGLGHFVVAGMLSFARIEAMPPRCRYVTLDAEPDLLGWYVRQGFVVNKIVQKQRVEAAAGKRDPAELTISMRFDLRAP
jgi:GNAT superfamily N-acetyltransferase